MGILMAFLWQQLLGFWANSDPEARLASIAGPKLLYKQNAKDEEPKAKLNETITN